jgi:hypothetical protein
MKGSALIFKINIRPNRNFYLDLDLKTSSSAAFKDRVSHKFFKAQARVRHELDPGFELSPNLKRLALNSVDY